MAADEAQQSKRRCGPKVRTGCGTCKIRRIKCDEAKPICQRCSATGRECDGYAKDITITNQTPRDTTAIIHRISVHTPGNAAEKRGFDFFLRNTAAELSGYYDSSFWKSLILAASAQKPSLRHAVIALGALHEDFSRTRLAPSTPSVDGEKAQFALNQHAKALGALRRSLSRGKEEPLTALLSCILFVCFDSLRGWYESAMVHLQSGLSILRDMRSSSNGNHIIEDSIAPLFMRLSIQSIIYVETKSIHDKTALARKLMILPGRELVPSGDFRSLGEARNALDQAAHGFFTSDYMLDANLPVILQPTDCLALSDKYISQLPLWNLAFEKFMAAKSKDLTSREVQGAALLKIHYTMLKIMSGIRPDISDTRPLFEAFRRDAFSEYLDDFRMAVNLARPLIAAAEEEAKKGKPPLTFSSDLGLVGPLYYVCINCPSSSIRKAAMELLLRCPRREGMWNSVLIAQMIQQYWDLEAKYMEAQSMNVEVDEFGFLAVDELGRQVPYTDSGSVHFAFFGRSAETNTTDVSHSPPLEVTSPQPMESLSPLGLRLNPSM